MYYSYFFFFNDTATTEIYTLSLHDALPICRFGMKQPKWVTRMRLAAEDSDGYWEQRGWDRDAFVKNMSRDRKSTRLNSSHANISYAVFCLKKKKKYILINTSLDSTTVDIAT